MRTTRFLLYAGLSLFAAAPTSAATKPTTAPLPRRAFLGAALADLTPEDRSTQHLGATDAGVLVRKVFPASTAEKAGIVDGDVLLSMDTTAAIAPARVVQAVAKRKSGEPVTLRWMHQGKPMTRQLAFAAPPKETGESWDVDYGEVRCGVGQLRTIVTRPRSAGRHPALLLVQGIGTFTVETPIFGVDGYGAIIRDFTKRGFVTMRVDKPGCGDSEGGPLRDRDFDSQLDGFRAALAKLRSDPAVDPERILIFGHSMGGVWGPLLGAETPVRGIAVYGTVTKTWTEYLLDNTRRQSALAGRSAAEVDSLVRLEAQACHYLYDEGLSPREMASRHPEMKAWVDSSMTDATYYSGCHYTFFQQLAKKNLARAWTQFPGYALAVYGRSDFLSGEEDHALVAQIVNAAHPGHGSFQAIDGIDHAFRPEATQAASFATWGQSGGELDTRVVDALRAWSEQVTAKTP